MRRALLGAALVSLLWLAACAGPGTQAGQPTSEQERREYAAALSLLADNPVRAEQRLQQFVQRWPRSPLAGDAALRLGKMAEARDDREAALRRYYYVVRNFPEGGRTDAARLHVAVLEYQRGNEAIAARQMAQTRLRQLSDSERHLAHRLLADTERDPVEKLRWLAALRSAERDVDALAGVDAEIDALLQQLDLDQLVVVAGEIEPDIPAARAVLTAAERALDAGQLEDARDRIERASALPLAPLYASRLALAADRLRLLESGADGSGALPGFADAERPETAKARGTIGVVLPLSGNFAAFGEESLRGILLAAGAFDALVPADRRPSVRVLIRDSAGERERAASAVRELARDESVSAVIGPLLSEECEAAAEAAQAEELPLLALTARVEVARGRPYAFRVRTRPNDEVSALAEYAMRELGAQRFAILYPRDAYGLGLSGLFWNAVEERGGRVVGLAAYDPDATDFAEPIRRLVGYELLTPQEKELIKEREKIIRGARRLPAEEALLVREEARAMLGPDDEPLPPIVDFDALFIPESHEKVVLIAPQLSFHELTGAQLLGSDAWNHPDLVSIARRHVEGALFTANYYNDSTVDFVRNFADRYAATYGVPAEDLAAQAYDATNLVLMQLARGAESRAAVRDGILSTQDFAGVSGVTSMLPDGNARKRPFLLGVRRGEVVQVD